jgi:hypothetical protein
LRGHLVVSGAGVGRGAFRRVDVDDDPGEAADAVQQQKV